MASINDEFIQDIKNAWKMKYPLDSIEYKLIHKKTNKLDVNYCNDKCTGMVDDYTPLLMTIEKYNDDPETYMKICQLLIKNKVDVNLRDNKSQSKMTPLMLAIECGSDDICKLLLDNGADINAIDNYGYTALMRVMNTQILSTCKLLLQYNPDLTIKDEDGNTALSLSKKYPEIHKLISESAPVKKTPAKSKVSMLNK